MPEDRLDIIGPALLSLEASFGLSGRAEPKAFVDVGEWLVRPWEICKSLPSWPLHHDVLPILAGRQLLRSLRQLSRWNTRHLLSAARFVNVRSHWARTGLVRAFYHASGTANSARTVKLAIGSADGRDQIADELRSRGVVARIGELKAPAIHSSGRFEETAFISEDWMTGRLLTRPGDVRVFRTLLFPDLIRHYRAYGIRLCGLPEVMSSDFAEQVEAASAQIDWCPGWSSREWLLDAVHRISDQDRCLPVSFCHADLNLGHVVYHPTRGVHLLDWGAAREMPLATDFVDLLSSWPNRLSLLYEECCSALQSVANEKTYSPSQQLVIASLRKAARWQELAQRCEAEGRPRHLQSMLRRTFAFTCALLQCRQERRHD